MQNLNMWPKTATDRGCKQQGGETFGSQPYTKKNHLSPVPGVAVQRNHLVRVLQKLQLVGDQNDGPAPQQPPNAGMKEMVLKAGLTENPISQ